MIEAPGGTSPPTMEQTSQIAIDRVSTVIRSFGLSSLESLLHACQSLSVENAPLDVAVFGQFKSGKSSLLNAIIGEPLLPVGAIPVTAVITRVSHGPYSARVTRLDASGFSIEPKDVVDFVSESRNPGNQRNVAYVDIVAPVLADLPGLRLVDTPGLGSVLEHNTQVTREWLPNVAVALVVVSSERPLSEDDLRLIKELSRIAPRLVVVLSKIDLVSPGERADVVQFLDGQITHSLGQAVRILPCSIREDDATHLARIKDEVLRPAAANAAGERQDALQLKLRTLNEACCTYLEAALSVAMRTDAERVALRKAVFDETVSESLACDELILAEQRLANSSRSVFEQSFLPERDALSSRIAMDLAIEMRTWSGRLADHIERFELWIKPRMTGEIEAISTRGTPVAENLVGQAETRFRRVAEALRDRLARNMTHATGVVLPSLIWQPIRPTVAKVPVAIGKTLDREWVLLSKIIPMWIFGGLFHRHCMSRARWEVQKNLIRLVGAWADSTTEAISELRRQAQSWIHEELATLENVLGRTNVESDHIRRSLAALTLTQTLETTDPQSSLA